MVKVMLLILAPLHPSGCVWYMQEVTGKYLMMVRNVRNILKTSGDHMSPLPSYFIWTAAVYTRQPSYFKFPN